MKKLTMFLALAVIFSTSFAQWQNNNASRQISVANYNNFRNSNLVVNSFSHDRYTIVIDNRYQYQTNGDGFNRNANTVNIGTINPGSHSVVVYELKTNFWGKQKQEVIFNSYVNLKPNVETSLNITEHDRVKIFEKVMFNDFDHHNNDRRMQRRDDDRRF